ncbi:hypothetical protein [Ciceribacter sp. RN22]|uniref:hypothetical protein n=1 Tax=Ciceribacter sp. RN22 TaxID=2954932 RepID=UPI0020936B05|nr:hypothetical protein [Ciceribacter sp. RN22]MCO6180261.1 hypothetical protein [Ciceribacter sp. RN22]
MSIRTKISLTSASISANHALVRQLDDEVDQAAVAFGDKLLLRIDPRDVRRTAENPTGRKCVHYASPNRDPLLFTGSGVSVETISGKYAGREVFKLTSTGDAGNGTHSDLTVGPKSLNNRNAFSIFGVAHYNADMLGTSGFHTLIGMYRDRSTLETAIAHQFVSGINYLSVYSDQGDGNGQNHILDASTVLAAGEPFVYLLIVYPYLPRVKLYVNSLDAPLITSNISTAPGVPEAGAMEMYIGHLTASEQMWSGAHGRGYVIAGGAVDSWGKDRSEMLIAALKSYYAIA